MQHCSHYAVSAIAVELQLPYEFTTIKLCIFHSSGPDIVNAEAKSWNEVTYSTLKISLGGFQFFPA